jgi:protease IV
MSFGRAFLSSCLGALVAMIAFVFLFFIFISAIVGQMASEKEVVIESNSVLHINLDAQINELQFEDPLAAFRNEIPKIGLLQLKQAIEHAKSDSKIEGIYLECTYPMAGFASLEEIRESLIDFRKSGKWVMAYNEVMSEGAYYVCTAADQIFLYPEGEVEFNGLTADVAFLKKLFDKLEIKPQVFRVGDFKSAVEPFFLEKMSPENRMQLTELINSIHDHMLTRVSEARKIPKEKLKDIADNFLVQNAAHAIEYGLVDSLLYKDQVHAKIKRRLNLDEKKKIRFVKYTKYRKSYSSYKSAKNEVAVIVADGPIVPGEADESEQRIGGDTYVEEIRKAREDKDVKAIVIRVNSPGGEFRASDMMWREVELARKSKPVIASMSDYATSGGYYLSMACDTIVAQPHTITGSIGIFGVIFDLSDFFDSKLGVTFDEVRTGKYGDLYTVTRPLNESEKKIIQNSLNDHYNTFTSKAAQGRGVSDEEIKKVASGRVWSGTQAKDRNLVDVLGNYNDAIRIAAEKAGVSDDYKVKLYPQERPFIERFVSQLEENATAYRLGAWADLYNQFRKVETYQGEQARMPFELRIH